LAVSLSVALFPDSHRFDTLSEAVFEELDERLASAARTSAVALGRGRIQRRASKLRRRFDKVAKALRQLSEDSQFKQRTEVEWLNRMSGFGFARVPAPLRRRKLKDDDIVHGDVSYPILWLPVNDDEIICSANGHSLSIGAHPNILRLLTRLNSGQRYRVGILLNENAGIAVMDGTKFELLREDVRIFLETLLSFGAIARN
jgi:50S ribosomal protein L16 3-hydroxylase